MILFICGFISGLLIGVLILIFSNKRKSYQCNGSIVMHEDELYLCLTVEDKKLIANLIDQSKKVILHLDDLKRLIAAMKDVTVDKTSTEYLGSFIVPLIFSTTGLNPEPVTLPK